MIDLILTKELKKFLVFIALVVFSWAALISFHKVYIDDEERQYIYLLPFAILSILVLLCAKYLLEL